MIYRTLGKTGKRLSGLGIGTNRFAPDDLKDNAGLDKCAEIIFRAVKAGVNYIDCGYTYSMFKAEEIVRRALIKIRAEGLNCYTSVKSMYLEDKTAEETLNRIHLSLKAMALSSATFGFAWRVDSLDMFDAITAKGGLYDGLVRAQNSGLIEHICISCHCSPSEIIEIMESGLFDACMISCNALNVVNFSSVFESARRKHFGIFTMNSLGGGVLIGRNTLQLKEYLHLSDDVSLAATLLSYLHSHEEITTCLSTMETSEQLDENLTAFKAAYKNNVNKIELQNKFLKYSGYCTKCRYCKGCPQGIHVSDMMYAYSNAKFTDMMKGYGNVGHTNDKDTFAASLFNPRFCDIDAIPKTSLNPCIRCGKCEKQCTQKLPIIQRIDEMYSIAREKNFNTERRIMRLKELLNNKKFKKVCFFPAGKYTQYVIHEYLRTFGEFPFELFVSDSNCKFEYTLENTNIRVLLRDEIVAKRPDMILITNYRFGDEIYEQLSSDNRFRGFRIEKLHKEGDIAWY